MINSEEDTQLVCAYLDNQLSSSDKEKFEKRLKLESHLQAQLSEFRKLNQAYQQASSEQICTPVPESVLSLLKPSINMQTSRKSRQTFIGRKAWLLAASVAAIAIIATLMSTQSYDEIEVSLFNSLSNTPSSELVWLDKKKTSRMLITLSFQHSNGKFCREYILEKHGQTSREIACKSQRWQVVLQVPSAPLSNNDTYLPAGESYNAEIEDYLNKNMKGDGMDISQEQVMISKKWQ